MRKEIKQVFKRKVALTLCAALMTVTVVSVRPAVAKDGKNHDQRQHQQQVQQEEQQEQQEVRLAAMLVGVTPFNGAFGFAEFEREGARAKLQIEVEDVNLADGTVLDVLVNGNPLAGVTLQLIGGKATLVLDSSKGQTIPMIGPGSTIAVTTTGGATVVHGMF
jgi:hypothetical protein